VGRLRYFSGLQTPKVNLRLGFRRLSAPPSNLGFAGRRRQSAESCSNF